MELGVGPFEKAMKGKTGLMSCILAAALVAQAASAQATAEQSARDLVGRLLPGGAFLVETIPADGGRDVFEIESSGDKIVLRGNNGVSVGSALNWYLKYYCQCQYSLNSQQLRLPKPLPRVQPKVRRFSQDH